VLSCLGLALAPILVVVPVRSGMRGTKTIVWYVTDWGKKYVRRSFIDDFRAQAKLDQDAENGGSGDRWHAIGARDLARSS
jgi:hypothetical protein